jgi:hypothetical protein
MTLKPAFAGEGGSFPLSRPAATFQHALGTGGCQSFACGLGDQDALNLGEQAELGNHNLSLKILLFSKWMI